MSFFLDFWATLSPQFIKQATSPIKMELFQISSLMTNTMEYITLKLTHTWDPWKALLKSGKN